MGTSQLFICRTTLNAVTSSCCHVTSQHFFVELNEYPHCFAFQQATVDNSRYASVCDGCDIECEGCTIEDNHTVPVCADLLEHTDSRDGTATLETLDVDPGYWRATSTSRIILPCFYKTACKGGVTGDPEYCLKGYEGPCKKPPKGNIFA